MMHRFLLDAPVGLVVDHINHDGLDNRRSNLRLATYAQNAANRRRGKTNSGYKGVTWTGTAWSAAAFVRGKRRHLGTFGTPADAARAYDRAIQNEYGEFACTNFGPALSGTMEWTAPDPLTLF